MPIDDASSRAEERVLLADQLTAKRFQIHRENLARVRRRECNALLALGLVREHRHEQAFAGQHALAGAEQRVDHASGAPLPSPKIVSIWMPGVMYMNAPASATARLARIELDLDELHLVAVDHEVDVVGAPAGRRRRRAQEPPPWAG